MSIRSGVRILNSLRLCRYETLQFQSVISILVSLKLTVCHALISLLPKRYCLPLGMCGYYVIYLVMLKCSMKMDNYMDIYIYVVICMCAVPLDICIMLCDEWESHLILLVLFLWSRSFFRQRCRRGNQRCLGISLRRFMKEHIPLLSLMIRLTSDVLDP